ncbi:MAG: hypothetical protein ACOX7U_05960 [Desulfitobacteriia bacterium]|jgi:hypothetical protein
MIIGFGFGSPLVALMMLVVTGALSYFLFKILSRYRMENNWGDYYQRDRLLTEQENYVQRRREYYYKQREMARRMMEKYDLTDEEIEEKIKEEINKEWGS